MTTTTATTTIAACCMLGLPCSTAVERAGTSKPKCRNYNTQCNRVIVLTKLGQCAVTLLLPMACIPAMRCVSQ